MVLLLALTACGAAPSPTPATPQPAAPAVAGKHGPSGPREPKSAPIDPALIAAIDELATVSKAAMEKCRDGVMTKLKAVEGTTQEAGLSVEELHAACAEIDSVLDRFSFLAPHFRSSNQLLGALARISEDKRVLTIETNAPAHAQAYHTAVDHLRRSVPDGLAAWDVVAKIPNNQDLQVFAPRHVPHGSVVSDLRRLLANDKTDFGSAVMLFDNYAWNQRQRPDLVRARLLTHFGRWFNALAGSHRLEYASWTPDDPADQATLDVFGAYVEACEGLSRTYVASSEPYLAGTLGDGDAERLRQAVVDAQAAWQAAHDKLAAAVGG